MSANLTNFSLHELSQAIATRRRSPVEIVEAYFDRIRRYDAKLHAFVELYESDARLAAEAADRAIRSGHGIGPFHGLPVAIKDVVEIAGRVTTGGSAVWRERSSKITATLVTKLVGAGMIVLGKTHTVEFAMGGWGTNQKMGTPWNPWDLQIHRCPGGSSAGSAVAIAARFAPCAIGSDTGGSVRLPSAYCGGVGLKTTLGRISGYGVLPMSPTLDSPGPMTFSVEDAALLFKLLHGPDPLDPSTMRHTPSDPMPHLRRGVSGLRLGILPRTERAGVDPEVLAAYDASVAELVNHGAIATEIALPHSFSEYGDLAGFIITTEIYSLLHDLVDRPELPLDEDVRPRILRGKNRSAAEYLRALREREAKKREFDPLFAKIDALLTPTIPTPAIPLEAIDQKTMPTLFTRWVGYLSLPALALPNGFTRGGLPVSLQVVAPSWDEATALRIGWAFEQATEWHLRRAIE